MIDLREDGFDAAFAAANRGDFAGADRLIGETIARTGGSLTLRVAALAATVSLQLGKNTEALAFLSLTAPHQPDAFEQLYHTAVALFRLGRPLEAVAPLLRAVELYPENVPVRLLLSVVLPYSASPKDVAAAQEHARRATELEPENPATHAAYGRILQHSSRAQDAEVALRRAVELNPNDALAWEQLGNALLELDQPEAAAKAYETTLALAPGAVDAARELRALRSIDVPAARRPLARFPRAQREFADLERAIDRYVVSDFADPPNVFGLDSHVFTLGSCFATNIANALRKYGVSAKNVPYPDDINNTYANRYLLEWLLGNDGAMYAAYQETFGEAFRQEQVAYLRACDVVIVSLGVAPCFFERESGAFVLTFGQNQNVALQNRRYTFRTTTVAENVDNLQAIMRMLREINPALSIFLTVSPVPLKATFERGSAVVADCVSKSTLRVAAEEIVRLELPRTYYWPSFEIVRWLGGHAGGAFGGDDGSPFHVTQSLVERIMYAFVRTFGDPDLAARAAAIRAAQAPAGLA